MHPYELFKSGCFRKGEFAFGWCSDTCAKPLQYIDGRIGSASGIGRAICNELVQQNVFVIISDINEQAGKDFEVELNNETIKARYVYLDVTKYESVEKLLTDVDRNAAS